MARWEAYLKQGLHALKTAWDLAVLLLCALALFTATAIKLPSAMRSLLSFVQDLRDLVAGQHLPDWVMLCADIFLQPAVVVFIFFAVATRLLFEGIGVVFNRGQFPAEAAIPTVEPATPPAETAVSPSPFSQW